MLTFVSIRKGSTAIGRVDPRMHPELLPDSSGTFSRRLASWLVSIGLVRSVALLVAVCVCISLLVRLAVHLATDAAADRQAAIGFASAALIPMLVASTTGTFVMRLLLDLERTRAQLHHIARTDWLTGALNRVAFMGRAEILVRSAAQGGHPMSLLMIDVDRFKTVNDTHGHAGGDKALEEVSQRCQAQLRHSDLFARFGGEEFVVLLPSTDESTAYDIAERMRVAVHGLPIEWAAGRAFSITVSIGSAHLKDCATLGAMLHRADQNLYHAKRLGRNTLCIG
jgi:diguanylate cyclase (GGDEF)-like protein